MDCGDGLIRRSDGRILVELKCNTFDFLNDVFIDLAMYVASLVCNRTSDINRN